MAGGEVSVVVYVEEALDVRRVFRLIHQLHSRYPPADLLEQTMSRGFHIIPKPSFSLLPITLTTHTLAPGFQQPLPDALERTPNSGNTSIDLDPSF